MRNGTYTLSEEEKAELTHLQQEHKAKKCWTGTVHTQEEENTPHATLNAVSTIVVDMTTPPNAPPIATATVAASTTDVVPADVEDLKAAAEPSVYGTRQPLFGAPRQHQCTSLHLPCKVGDPRNPLVQLLPQLILNPLWMLGIISVNTPTNLLRSLTLSQPFSPLHETPLCTL